MKVFTLLRMMSAAAEEQPERKSEPPMDPPRSSQYADGPEPVQLSSHSLTFPIRS